MCTAEANTHLQIANTDTHMCAAKHTPTHYKTLHRHTHIYIETNAYTHPSTDTHIYTVHPGCLDALHGEPAHTASA